MTQKCKKEEKANKYIYRVITLRGCDNYRKLTLTQTPTLTSHPELSARR